MKRIKKVAESEGGIAPAKHPCGSCPYRRDVPSGIWSREEYLKLPAYDGDTAFQPTGMFLCHQQNGKICAGWAGTHDMAHSLAIRLTATRESAATIKAILNYRTDTPLFSSGAEACEHGLRDLNSPNERALQTITTLNQKRRLRHKR